MEVETDIFFQMVTYFRVKNYWEEEKEKEKKKSFGWDLIPSIG